MKRIIALTLALLLGTALLPTLAEEPATEPPLILTAFETVKYGDKGDQVSSIQERLKELGYYTGKVTGNYLDGTYASVRRFQLDYGMEQTGEVDSATFDKLNAAEYRVVKNGDDGDDVTRLQQHLIDLGYLDTKATGKFRSATESAVRAFQKQNNLTITGEGDLSTQQLLYSGRGLAKGAPPTPTPDPSLDVGDINDVVMVDDGASTEDSRSPNLYSRKLIRGAKGEEVKAVQTRLTELGFFDGPISGNYMNQTISAVEAFQLQNGLNVSGDMDEETWNTLFNAADVVDVHATPKPSPVPTPVPYKVTVDVRNQVTTVYGLDENGGYTNIVRQMICSTGMKATPSDVGDWVTNGRRARWAFFSLYGSHAQYWTRINDNIAFHSVIYRDVDTMALSVKSYNVLGQRASHGCIRLLVSDAQWIYENIRAGITVTVTEDLPEDVELTKSLLPPPLNKSIMWPSTTPEPTPAPNYTSDGMPPQPLRRLQLKSEGEDVYWLQMKLKELGYYTGTVTGAYWTGTQRAVKAYQKDHGLRADGTAGTNTLNKIYEDILAANTPTPMPTETPELTATPAPTPGPDGTFAPDGAATPAPETEEESVEITTAD